MEWLRFAEKPQNCFREDQPLVLNLLTSFLWMTILTKAGFAGHAVGELPCHAMSTPVFFNVHCSASMHAQCKEIHLWNLQGEKGGWLWEGVTIVHILLLTFARRKVPGAGEIHQWSQKEIAMRLHQCV